MCLTTGYSLDCNNSATIGGISRVWITDRANVTALVPSVAPAPLGQIASITMSGVTVFKEIEFMPDSSFFNDNGNRPSSSTYLFNQELNITIPNNNRNLRNFIMELAKCTCGFVVIVEYATGYRVVAGFHSQKFRSLRLASNENVSGTASADANQATISLTCDALELAQTLDPNFAIPV